MDKAVGKNSINIFIMILAFMLILGCSDHDVFYFSVTKNGIKSISNEEKGGGIKGRLISSGGDSLVFISKSGIKIVLMTGDLDSSLKVWIESRDIDVLDDSGIVPVGGNYWHWEIGHEKSGLTAWCYFSDGVVCILSEKSFQKTDLLPLLQSVKLEAEEAGEEKGTGEEKGEEKGTVPVIKEEKGTVPVINLCPWLFKW